MTRSLALERIAERIGEAGPIRFDEFMDLALYAPGAGFYETVGAAGRREGDFITSVEVGSLFGAVLARRIDEVWRQLGEPDPFTVVDAGAGRGTLARSVLAAEPTCLDALRYVLVERSVALRARQGEHLELDRRTESRDQLPDEPVTGVVVANELLDNLPTRLLRRDNDSWSELLVDMTDNGTFAFVAAPTDADDAARADAFAPEASAGAVVPLQDGAAGWLRAALDRIDSGIVVALDYADTTASLASRPPDEWLRTYRGHRRGDGPLDHPGQQDITCEVAVDQLAAVAPPTSDLAQADWLRAHGVGELVEEGRRIWEERAHVGDLTAVKAKSRITEAEALSDPAGLGAFRVLEWSLGGAVS